MIVFLLLAQFSPGDLAKAHEKLEGLTHCTSCHKGDKQLGPQACLTCHTELEARIQAKAGYHGRMPSAQLDKCQSCHHEHRGKEAKLVDWGPSGIRGFEHAKTGFALHGKHAAIKCDACHDTKLMDAPARALAAKWRVAKTFLGLQSACTDCHADEHRGQVGDKCESCHDATTWKPAPLFNHGKTEFPLTGAHKTAACTGCHKREASTVQTRFPPLHDDVLKLAPVAHERCVTCHDDPHRNQFGQRCESCHTTASWHAIQDNAKERAFHDKTHYPLKGAHAFVECKDCHGPFGRKPAKFKGLSFEKCTSCHNDAHRGQLKDATCERCHTVQGFTPSRFEREDHASFALAGAHLTAPCNGCHLSPAAKTPPPKRDAQGHPLSFASVQLKLKVDAGKCEACHADPHGKQFSGACKSCHGVDSFHATSFDHASTRFALTGAHAKATCGQCHAADAKGVTRYKGTPAACESCHSDIHGGQFSIALGDGQPARACVDCHGSESFKRGFDHDKARFALGGKHQALACEACHKAVKVGSKNVVRYRPLPIACESCHKDPHGGAFKGFEP